MDQSIFRKLWKAYLAAENCVDRLRYVLPRLDQLPIDEMMDSCANYQAVRIDFIRDIGAATDSLRNARFALSGPPPTCGGLSATSAHELAFDLSDRMYARLAFRVNQQTLPLLRDLYTAAEQGNEVARREVAALEINLPHLDGMVQEARTGNFSLLEAEVTRELQVAKETAKRERTNERSEADQPIIVPAKQRIESRGPNNEGNEKNQYKDGQGEKKSKPIPRLSVDLERRTITLDGQTYDVSSKMALRWVKVLADHPDEWISGPELEQYDSELLNPRTDRWRKQLQEPIRDLIDSKEGAGSRIRL